jgi:hypothetical protein
MNIHVLVLLGDTLSSHNLLLYVYWQFMGNALRLSFDRYPHIEFNTLSKRGIYKLASTLELVILSGRLPQNRQ